MKWIKYHKKELLSIIIPILVMLDLIWSIGNERKFFYWDSFYNPNSIAFYLVVKVLYVILIGRLGYQIYKILMNPQKYVPIFKDWLKYAWPILVVYGLLIIVLWPGNWGAVADEVQVYLSVKNLRVWPDQGIMSSLFMLLCLMIYPKVWMITLVQGSISIIMIGSTIRDVVKELACNRFQKWLFVLLFISPPALCFVLCPIRVWLYLVLLIALIENIYLLKKCTDDKKRIDLIRKEAILCALVVNYRSEGILFLFTCIAITLFAEKRKPLRIKHIIFLLVFVCGVTFGLKELTALGNGNTLRQHSGLTFVTTLSMIFSDEDKYVEIDREDLDNIDAVFEVDVLREHPSMSAAFDGTRAERSFAEPTQEQMAKYMKSAIKIIKMNLPVFFKCKWEAAKWSLGVYPYYRTVGTIWTQNSLDEWNENTDLPGNMSDDFREFADNHIRVRVSNMIVSAFRIGSIDSFYIFYAFWLPCLLLPIVGLAYLIKRNWIEGFVCVCICIQIFMVIIMAPGRYQMYYLPFYFLGWFETFRLKR